MYAMKLQVFLKIFAGIFIPIFLLLFFATEYAFFAIFWGIPISLFILAIIRKMGLYDFFSNLLLEKYYIEQEERDFQKGIRRKVEEKRALSQVENDNLRIQNQEKIIFLTQVAQIQIQSNQYLLEMYQSAMFNMNNNQQYLAYQQLTEIQDELTRQGLI